MDGHSKFSIQLSQFMSPRKFPMDSVRNKLKPFFFFFKLCHTYLDFFLCLSPEVWGISTAQRVSIMINLLHCHWNQCHTRPTAVSVLMTTIHASHQSFWRLLSLLSPPCLCMLRASYSYWWQLFPARPWLISKVSSLKEIYPCVGTSHSRHHRIP